MTTTLLLNIRRSRIVDRIAMAEHHVREYVKRVASIDIENYPEWDTTVIIKSSFLKINKKKLICFLAVSFATALSGLNFSKIKI